MKKSIVLSAVAFATNVFASQTMYIDFVKVIDSAQITVDVRREFEQSNRELESDISKINEFCMKSQQKINSFVSDQMKAGSRSHDLIGFDAKTMEIDSAQERDMEQCRLKAKKEKLQLMVTAKVKDCETEVRKWATDFAKSKKYSVIIDKKDTLFVAPELDATEDFLVFCDQKFLSNKSKNTLLASAVKDIDQSKSSTLLASTTKPSGEVVA